MIRRLFEYSNSNEASWAGAEPEMTSEPVDLDDTTISSSNLGPRDPCSYEPTADNDDEVDEIVTRPGNPWASFF